MTILITGATGNVGRPLVEGVGAGRGRGARSKQVPGHGRPVCPPAGGEVVPSAADALRGVSAVFLNSRALGTELATVVELAAQAGVHKLVALSALNVDDDVARQPSRVRGDRNRETEQLAVGSGLTWVSLRPSVFMSNFAGMWSPQIRAGDVVAGPYASAPIVDRDSSAIAAKALLTDDLDGRRIPLTGPEALTNTELAEVVAEVLGRPATSFRQWVTEHTELFN
jgi:uncharacterized protein YbjT (DUF2867 family)